MRRHGNSFRDHLAKRDVHRVRVGQKYWRFTFSEAWGPLLTDEWGEPVDNTPLANEEHPFWDAFEAWLAAHDASRMDPPVTSRPRQPMALLGVTRVKYRPNPILPFKEHQ